MFNDKIIKNTIFECIAYFIGLFVNYMLKVYALLLYTCLNVLLYSKCKCVKHLLAQEKSLQQFLRF